MSDTPSWHQIREALWNREPEKDLTELLTQWGRYEIVSEPDNRDGPWIAETQGLRFVIPDDIRARFWQWLKISKYI